MGAASTLGSENPHRGGAHFPVPIWRGSADRSAKLTVEEISGDVVENDDNNVFILKASLSGAEYML